MTDPLFSSISFKNVLKAKLFDVEKVTLNYQNGGEVSHNVVKRKPTITVIPLTKNYEIFFIKQYRYLLKKENLELVAGFIDEGESPLQAAKRELKEEAGITATQWEQLLVTELAASVTVSQNSIFLAQGLEIGNPNPERDEVIRICKLSLEEALEKVFTGQIPTAESIIGVLLIEALRKEGKI